MALPIDRTIAAGLERRLSTRSRSCWIRMHRVEPRARRRRGFRSRKGYELEDSD